MLKYNIRPAEEKDKWSVLDWRNHKEVRDVTLTSHIISRENHSIWWSKTMASNDRKIYIFEKEKTPVGVISIYNWDHEKSKAWWGFFLDNSNLQQQQKTEVWLALEEAVINFTRDELNIHELYCESMRKNELAWRLHKKCGFIECAPPEDATDTDKDVVYMKIEHKENKKENRPPLYLFASFNTNFLTESIAKESNSYASFPYSIKESNFGSYKLDLLDPNKPDLNGNNACYIFIERIEDFFPDIYTTPEIDNITSIYETINDYFSFIRNIALRGNKIYVADFAIQRSFPYSLAEKSKDSSLNRLLFTINKELYKLREEHLIEIIPYSSIINDSGRSFSNKYWYIARNPFSSNMLSAYARSIIGVVLSTASLSARVLVLDLDNTLWKGVIGDDGLDGIYLGGDFPGNIYKDLQILFKSLKDRGLLLTISSKNTEDIALSAIEEHPEMQLRKNDFISWKINWQPKSQNIRNLATELNLGLQSFCFIDDNPVEREEVRINAPEVMVPELPQDPADWYEFISSLPELYLNNVSESDKKRSEFYKQRSILNKASEAFADKTEFINSLDIMLKAETLNKQNFARTHQLFSKTNQFNTTTIRYTKEYLLDSIESNENLVIHLKYKDKYTSDFEGIAALMITMTDKEWIIDNFVMSCRVMGRQIEKVILNDLLRLAKKDNKKYLIGKYIPSNKNMPIENLYKDSNFNFSNKETHWFYNLNDQVEDDKLIIKLDWEL